MLLKRYYKPKAQESDPFVLDHVLVGHTGVHIEQNFSARLVVAGMKEGWIAVKGDKLTLNVKPEALHYTVKRMPGHYCLHCGEKLQSSADGLLAQLHVAEQHTGKKSPDKNWPGGYSVTNAFECVLDKAEHDNFKASKFVGFPRVPRMEG